MKGLKIDSILLVEKGARWFVRPGGGSTLDRGFRSILEASEWIDSHGDALLWRVGYLFRIKGYPVDVEIVNRNGIRALS
jgi:hypothetical protein